jgi:hypothetical protein
MTCEIAVASRAWCIECPQRELILPNVKYENVLEMLECIHPTYKDVDEKSLHSILPLAFDYQAGSSFNPVFGVVLGVLTSGHLGIQGVQNVPRSA